MIAQRDIDVIHGHTRLRGKLTTPDVGRPVPAIVFLHGSGPVSRDAWEAETRVFVHAGVATLAYDKRSDWTRQSFEDRAVEALDALRTLEAEGDFEPIGLLGGSQGAWIAPMAAAASTEVSFVVCASASGLGPRKQDLYRVEHQLRADGFDERQIAAALAAWHERDRRLRSGEDPAVILTAEEGYRDKPWYPYLASDEPDVLAFAQRIWDFDVVPYLERCRCPLLGIWGEADPIVPAQESRRIFEQALREAGNRQFELVVVRGADHGLRGGDIERDDVTTLIADWILRTAISL